MKKEIRLISNSNVGELFDTSMFGLTQEKVVKLCKQQPYKVEFYVSPVKVRGRKHKEKISILFEIYFDVSEEAGVRKRRGVVVTHRNGPRQFKFETAFKFLTEEIGLQEVKTLSFKERIERGM